MITFNDIHIGDTVITKYGDKGIIVNIASVAFLNHKQKFAMLSEYEKPLYKYEHDDVRKSDMVMYHTVTLCVDYHYLVGCDLKDIKEVITPNIHSEKTFLQKIRNFFHI